MKEAAAALILKRIKGLGDYKLKSIYDIKGSFSAILEAGYEELVYMGFDLFTAESIAFADISQAEKELEALQRKGIKAISLGSSDYPELLKEIADPPPLLYVKGNTACFKELGIAVIGSRKPSRQSEIFAHKLSHDLASCGISIISGFAYGIDISAHKGAIDAKGATIAVLGSGLGNIYPAGHAKYIDAVCKDGCILTEFDYDEKPAPYNFPKRNRVISGLSRGIVVVEASARSGSLITARLGLEHGREVYAVPSSPFAQNNATNSLIGEGKAALIDSYLKIIEDFKHLLNININEEKADTKKVKFDREEKNLIYNTLSQSPMGADELVICVKMPYSSVILLLSELELEGYLEKGADGRYSLTTT